MEKRGMTCGGGTVDIEKCPWENNLKKENFWSRFNYRQKFYIPRIVCSIAAALPCGIAYQNFGAPK
jgi:hypothetical protein